MRKIPSLALPALLALLGAVALASGETPHKTQEHYNSCAQTVSSDPEQTYKRARVWYQETKALAAQHCMALALFKMRDYEGAANALEEILRGLTPNQGTLWLNMKSQAAKAHLASGNHTAAEQHLSEALRWALDQAKDAEMLPLLLQRAKLYSEHNQDLRAVQDLDHALTIRKSATIYIERAKLFRKMGRNEAAQQDAKAALKEEPGNIEAQALSQGQ